MGIDVRIEPRGYEIEFVPLGCIPGPLQYKRRRKGPAKCFLLAEEEGERSVERDLVGSLLQRYLLRGFNIPPTPKVEEMALQKSGVAAGCEKSEGEEEKYSVLEERRPDFQRIGKRLAQLNCTEIPMLETSLQDGEEKLFDSEIEEKFLTVWARENFQKKAAYLFPQYHLRNLTGDLSDQRRVDFLYYDSTHKESIVIELDGAEHDVAREVDREREERLRAKNVTTIRVPNSEVRSGRGAQLDTLMRTILGEDESVDVDTGDRIDDWAKAVLCCDEALAFQYALTRMLQKGKIGGERVVVEVEGCIDIEVIRTAAYEWMELGRAVAQIHGIVEGSGVPERIEVREAGQYGETGQGRKIQITFEPIPAWWHRIPETRPDVIIRPAVSPTEPTVKVRFPNEQEEEGINVREHDAEKQKAGLKIFLQDAFRKRDFREAQEEAIIRCLAGQDTVVLLPTGAGKSLIYQMVSLVKPGFTLVVAPLVSLIEDQFEGLKEVGIDRVVIIHGDQDTGTRQEAQKRLRDGEAPLILIVTPERLLDPKFQDALGFRHQVDRVGVVAIDEAHCVSEWGHDFRPVYLQTGKVLRRLLGPPTRPIFLALTGTASRAVFRDMMAHLEIDRNDAGAAIRPRTHNRPEIKMQLEYCRNRLDASTVRAAKLKCLPDLFETRSNRFWTRTGKRASCGIVFMPTVRNRMNNIDKGMDLVRQEASAVSIVTYAGSGPHRQRRHENAQQYKRNEAVVMVATSAYGMGIDKPNVRWVMHPHLTMSLEEYYQQIGRAGRDRQEAHAIAVMYEEDPQRTDSVLDPEKEWEEAERAYQESRDDVGTALHFHFEAFKGRAEEKDSLRKTIERLQLGRGAGERQLPFRDPDIPMAEEDQKKERQRDLGRLARLGIVDYYQMESGPRRFTVFVDQGAMTGLIDKLEEYISRFDRAQAASVKENLRGRLSQAGEEIEAQAYAAAEVLVDYLYSSVERARRRAIYEMVRMARTCRRDEDIREWMLGYLSEDKAVETLEELLDAERVEWDRFAQLFDDAVFEKQTGVGELRGMFSRALESHPEHPVCLLGRATAEAISDDGKFEVVEQDVRAALKALPKYLANSELDPELARMAEWIRSVGERTGGQITRVVQWMCWQLPAECGTLGTIVRGWDAEPHEETLAELFHVRDVVRQLGKVVTTWAEAADQVANESESA